MEITWRPSAEHTLKAVGAGYVLDEISGDSNDPYMLGGQLRWDGVWSKRVSSTAGVLAWNIASPGQLSNSAVPNRGKGNTRDKSGNLIFDYNSIQVDGGLTYSLDKFPMYNALFPITVFTEYINNPAVDKHNGGWAPGLRLGKSGKKGLWDISYEYRVLGADAWYEEVTESDFGENYRLAPPGGSLGYGSGTIICGHITRSQYAPYDSLTLSVTYFLTELINEIPPTSDSETGRLQVDAVLKF